MSEVKRLNNTGGATVHAQDGKVHVTLWLEGRRPADDPLRIELPPGDALDLAGDIVKSAKAALLRQLGAR